MAKLRQNSSSEDMTIPALIPLLPLQDAVVFPMMQLHLNVERPFSQAAVQYALANQRLIFVTAQRQRTQSKPHPDELYAVGTVCLAIHSALTEEGLHVLIQGVARGMVERFDEVAGITMVSVEPFLDLEVADDSEQRELVRTVVEQYSGLADAGGVISEEMLQLLRNIKDPAAVAYALAGSIRLTVEEGQALLETSNPITRLRFVSEYLQKEAEVLSLRSDINSSVNKNINKQQKDYYLREQMKEIQRQLGEDRPRDHDDLKRRILAIGLPEVVEREALRQLSRLERMPQEGAEGETIRNYLDWIVELPWNKTTEDAIDIARAQQILDEDHAFLEKIKERILEFLAVHKLRQKDHGSIICFVGPPGVGKTSLGRSIARAMNRKFVRISLGGIHDEADIRGHRRTYIGAMPGRIIYGLKQAGTKNPVFMLDEIDKIGSGIRGGDPYAALLEVLDPEQNNSFVDHFLNVPFDLSKVVFITTANSLEPVPTPLIDRMEIIELHGYTEDEKLSIALRYIVGRQVELNGLRPEQISFSEEAITELIRKYTREAGLRNLERSIGRVCRRIARKVAEGMAGPHLVDAASTEELMGEPPRIFDTELGQDHIGTATGLAWTPVGGEILFVEVMVVEGHPALQLTGSLGDVMKESANAALTYIRANADRFGIPKQRFMETALHIHVPAGALPKDGPSAGITIATAILSALMKTPVRHDVAMTGEISLRGKVLPVGGVKEKILGATRAGIKVVVIPESNLRDLVEIPAQVLQQIQVVPAGMIDEVFTTALVTPPSLVMPLDPQAVGGPPQHDEVARLRDKA